MIIEFKEVLPKPLEAYQHANDSVWKRNFTINMPQKIVLNASSGKGKSTFVNTLYGVRHDYQGSIHINGEDISSFDIDRWSTIRTKQLSVVFQDLQLFPDLTVWQNLLLKNSLTNHKTEGEILNMLDQLGIADKKDQIAQTLSYGQQQRVAIIRALLQPFELLLMDEPFSHLDEANTQIALNLINAETASNNAGFILTTLGSYHNFNFEGELKL